MSEVSNVNRPSVPHGISSGLVNGACVVALGWGAFAAKGLIIPLLLAAMLAFTATPLIRLLTRLKFPPGLAIGFAVVMMLAPLFVVAGGLAREVKTLVIEHEKIVLYVNTSLAQATNSEWAHKFGIHEAVTLANLASMASQKLGEGLQFAVGAFQMVIAATSEAAVVFLFALLMLFSRMHIYRCSLKILERWEGFEAARMLEVSTSLVEQFLLTKMLVALIVGCTSALLLWLLGIGYSCLLGAIVGALTMIPNVGFIVSLVPVGVVALATGANLSRACLAVGAMIIIHLIDSNALTPKLLSRKLNLNSLATFVGLFAGGLLWGVWGMFLSIPLLGVVRIVFSVSPSLAPWGDLMSDRQDDQLTDSLITRRFRKALGVKKQFKPRPVISLKV